MSVAGALALRACEQVERTGGLRAGVVAWKTLAQNTSDAEVRAKALSAGMRCGLGLRDASAIDELIGLWVAIDRGAWPVATLARDLVRAGMTSQAVDLAEAEATRHRTAASLYAYARILDVTRDARAHTWFAQAIEHAERDGEAAIATAARARRVALLARSWDTLGEALAEAAKLDPKKVEDPIALARVQLLSGSRFTRAAAIDVLADAARSEDVAVRLRARRLAARYADEAGDITPLERDRLNAFLKESLSQDLAGEITERARDILRGRYEVPGDAPDAPPADARARRLHRHDELLDVVVAMRDGAPARAARSLVPVALALEAGERLPRETLAVAHAALVSGDSELRDVAIRVLRSWLETPSFAAPPRGFLGLADALADAGQVDLALSARRAAALRREPNAVSSLATSLARVGWEAAQSDDRAHAIRLLREAKALILKG